MNFHHCRTSIDTDFGPATQTCVTDYQNQNNLPVTGNVDEQTWSSLVKPMTGALLAPTEISTMSAAEVVLVVANQHVKPNPVEIGGANCGLWGRLYCEGNTNDEGSREGFEACRRKRSLKKGNYDFIRFE